MHAYLQLCASAMHVSVCMLNSASIACFYIYSREIYHIILYFSFILQWTVRLITLHTLQWVQTKHLAWQALQLILWWILVSYSQAPLPHPTPSCLFSVLVLHRINLLPVSRVMGLWCVYPFKLLQLTHRRHTDIYTQWHKHAHVHVAPLITCTSSLFNATQTHSTSFNTCTNTIERHRHACIHQSLAPLPFPFSPLSFPF